MMGKVVPRIGIICSLLYLTAAIFVGSSFGIRVSDKDEIVKRMERAVSVPEACNVARPFLSLTSNAFGLAKVTFGVSCGLAVVNVVMFSLLLRNKGAVASAS